jgi:hypothetical protein
MMVAVLTTCNKTLARAVLGFRGQWNK